jgi:phospho-N-acetylmuramoyl-pentapeptide-transferase
VKTILVAGGVSLLLALLGTPLAIRVFTRRGYGQLIREEGPAAHVTKRGTPTMGGTVIVIASVVGYFVGNLATGQTPQASGLLVMMLMAGLGLVGFIDDFIKIYKQRSLGLRSSAKLAGQAVVGAVFALLVLQQRFADGYDITPAVPARLRAHPGAGAVRAVDRLPDRRHVQRGEPHRRAGRPGHRVRVPGPGRLRADRGLAGAQ